ncbi:MAG: HNH nuclease family protein [Syntrophobacteraceae bacterium]|nr:HNH nuclease family protein [Syntrophobacteraceae bacterium]
MSTRRTPSGGESMDQVLAEARRREKTYRERALKLFPWICARCGREFSGKRLRELTVHHKDHNHDNNPPDGSNWELLCLFCHDNEHSRYVDEQWYDDAEPGREPEKPSTSYKAFAGLDALLKNKK